MLGRGFGGAVKRSIPGRVALVRSVSHDVGSAPLTRVAAAYSASYGQQGRARPRSGRNRDNSGYGSMWRRALAAASFIGVAGGATAACAADEGNDAPSARRLRGALDDQLAAAFRRLQEDAIRDQLEARRDTGDGDDEDAGPSASGGAASAAASTSSSDEGEAFSAGAGESEGDDEVEDALVSGAAAGGAEAYTKHRRADPQRTHHGNTPLAIFSGSANISLARLIADELQEDLGKVTVGRFADGEVNVHVHESVRGRDVYVVQPTSPPVNEHLLELMLIISTLRRASAKRITAVVPYYGYKRDVGRPSLAQALRTRLGATTDDDELPSAIPVSAADVAAMLTTMGVDRVLAIDLQPPGQGQIEGFFDPRVPVDSLRSTAIAVSYIAKLNLANPVVVAPNESCVELAHDFRSGMQRLASDNPGEHKRFENTGFAVILEGGPSRGMDRYLHDYKRIKRMDLVGDVRGRDVVLVDDMIDSGGTLQSRVALLRDAGARRVFAFATHGLFNGPCVKRINDSAVELFVVTDTVPLTAEAAACSKIVQVSVAPILAEAVHRMHLNKSLQGLRVYSRDNVAERYKGQGW